MPGLVWLLVAVAGVFAVADWLAVATESKPGEYVAKPAVMFALIGVALVLDPADDVQRAWFVAALALSLLGDVFLMLPRDGFVAGLGAFLLAHVAYIAGFLEGGLEPAALGAGIAVAVGAAIILGRPVLSRARRLQVPVGLYMLALGAMLAVAFGSGRPIAAAGAALFFVSDTLIGWRRFVRERPWMGTATIVTYHLGQGALVLSLVG